MKLFDYEQMISGIDENRNGRCRLTAIMGTEEHEKELNLGLVGVMFRHVLTEKNNLSFVEVDIIFRNPGMQQMIDLFDALKTQDLHLQSNGVPMEQYAVCLQFGENIPNAVGGIFAVAPYTWSLASEKPGMIPDRIRLLFSYLGIAFFDPDDYGEELEEEEEGDPADAAMPWENLNWGNAPDDGLGRGADDSEAKEDTSYKW